MKRTQPKKGSIRAAYLTRKEEEVLFVRRTGDYQKTPEMAFDVLITFLRREGKLRQISAFYGIGLDDPQIVELGKLRFDACVSLQERIVPKGEVGKKVLRGGPFALFVHKGSYRLLEKCLMDIFQHWYPNSNKEVADAQPIFEYPELLNDAIEEAHRITNIYLPLKY